MTEERKIKSLLSFIGKIIGGKCERFVKRRKKQRRGSFYCKQNIWENSEACWKSKEKMI